jgi:hypothetical protein
MKRSTLVFAVCVLSLVIAAGCTKKEAAAPSPAAQMQPGAPMPQAVSLSGKVVETMNSGGYTYVNLENNGQKTWVAIPATPVKVGQEVKCQPGTEMRNFTSNTLKRTFASIFFSGGLLR